MPEMDHRHTSFADHAHPTGGEKKTDSLASVSADSTKLHEARAEHINAHRVETPSAGALNGVLDASKHTRRS